jgi:hypothetical protein
MGRLDTLFIILVVAALSTGTLNFLYFVRRRIFNEIWNPIFVIISSFVDVINIIYVFNNISNIDIINAYCLVEPILFFLIWTKGQITRRKQLIIFLIIYGIFIVSWIFEQSDSKPTYVAYSSFWYALFFSYVFVNMLADSIVRSFSNISGRVDLFFYLGLLLYLSFDVVTGLFDNLYDSLSKKFYHTIGLIKIFNMIAVYMLYSYYNVCTILKKTYS